MRYVCNACPLDLACLDLRRGLTMVHLLGGWYTFAPFESSGIGSVPHFVLCDDDAARRD